LKVSDQWRYRNQAYMPDEMAGKIVEAALRKEIAGESYSGLQQSPENVCDRALRAVKDHIDVHCGLTLLQVAIDKVAAPQGEMAVAAAKAVVEAEAAAKGVLEVLETSIKIRKPLTFKRPKSQA
jgi:hypothetical protein